MGNNGSQLGDEPEGFGAPGGAGSLDHFDHNFKGALFTTYGPLLTGAFGELVGDDRPIQITCKGNSMELVEDIGLTSRKRLDVNYSNINAVAWDHSSSQVKLTVFRDSEENFVILTMQNSVEFEGELKLRYSSGIRPPATSYIGMFAGATKPKPFQRKRPNLSTLPNGKLPSLHEMRSSAMQLHKGSYRPCVGSESRRLAIALEHIYEGHNTFSLTNVRGNSGVARQWRNESVLQINDEALIFKPNGTLAAQSIEFIYDDIQDWTAVDNDNVSVNDSGIEITCTNGETIYFGVTYIRDVKHTLEYFWNNYRTSVGQEVKMGSTHGRPLVTVTTLSGEAPASASPVGAIEVIDQDGMTVRPGSKMAPRKTGIASGITSGILTKAEPTTVPFENRQVKKHWHKVVVHQGWLLKKGGVGIGETKSWIKRYFVLYKTSQGHFLVYYTDFTDCPMFSQERHQRNVVDLAKASFIRPGSNKAESGDTPPHSFDIVTIEREWTLCAESQENMQRWLKLLTRAVDEDVAIIPDEELIFKVKPKVDPMGILNPTDYSTTLKISAFGMSVCSPEPNASTYGASNLSEREHYFWVYTDFYKWSLLSQAGKKALLVNVFADSSFSRRNEYIFRNKEADRLASAVEFYIEKFMSVMHVRLETVEGIFEATEAAAAEAENEKNTGMHAVSIEEFNQAADIDLLGMDPPPPPPSFAPPPPPSSDPFGSDPFGSPAPPAYKPAPTPSPFGSDPFGSPVPVSKPAPSASLDLLGDPFSPAPVAPPSRPAPSADPFGLDPFGAAPTPAPAPKPVVSSGFGDPFGDDPFFGGSVAPAPSGPKTAPPLSPAQIAQHKTWLMALFRTSQGQFYDDGTLQIAIKVEVRGSQARVSFIYRNQSPGTISDLKITMDDPEGLLRHEFGPLPPTLAGLAQANQQMMIECMKPVALIPKLSVSYTDALLGKKNNTIELPLSISSFNESLTLSSADFSSRWQVLTGAGQECQEVVRPPTPIVPAHIHAAFTTMMKFGRVSGMPDQSDFVVYGASSLRTGAPSPSGEKLSIGCLVKLELNVQANAVRLTVRSQYPAASQSSLAIAKKFLLEG